jgi:predicted ABC-type ATPase
VRLEPWPGSLAPRPNSEPPVFLIIAGPNGSGKSTAYSRSDVGGFADSVWIVNPDLLTLRLHEAEAIATDAANLEAVKRLEVWLEATLRVHQTVGVETVLSTDKYRRLVSFAKSLGFTFQLFYVMLASPEDNIRRVRDRVSKGGHNVPPEKIVDRYWRSLEQLPWFVEQADIADIYDNTGASPRHVATKIDGELSVLSDAPANLLKALGLARQ